MGEIEGVSETTRRIQGLNLSGGHVNCLEISVTVLGVPDFDTMLDAYYEDTGRNELRAAVRSRSLVNTMIAANSALENIVLEDRAA